VEANPAAVAARRKSRLLVEEGERFIGFTGAILSQLPVRYRLRKNGCDASHSFSTGHACRDSHPGRTPNKMENA